MTVTAPELLRGGPPPCLLHLHRFPACLCSGPPGTRHRRTPNEGREVQGPLDVTAPLTHPRRGLPFTCVSPWGFVTVSRPRAPMPPTHTGRGTRETGRGPAEAGEARGGEGREVPPPAGLGSKAARTSHGPRARGLCLATRGECTADRRCLAERNMEFIPFKTSKAHRWSGVHGS